MEKIDSKIMRSEAGRCALIFGAVSGAYVFLEPLLAGAEVNLAWLTYLASLAKLVGLIILMRWCMKKLASSYEGVGVRQLRRFGMWIALFSATITALCSYVAVEFVFADTYAETLKMTIDTLAPMLDANSMSSLEGIEEHFGVFNLGVTLIWCYIYGCILSAILSSTVAGKQNPFDEEDD
ncbi:MAG: DUF4199 domain-containing protein [Bacteroidales bacterium]|nr:DUF4199 domain-containing protein [Candidatus Cryptobacteroides aphodequi]